MSKRSKRPRGQQAGVAVSPKQKEQMLQLYMVHGNYTRVAENMGLSLGCVTKHIKAMMEDPDPEMAKARARAARQIASKVDAKVHRILDSINDEDLESGLIKTFDEETGALKSVKSYGPGLLAKVTAGAILIDKTKVMAEQLAMLEGERQDGNLLMPGDVGALLQGVRSKIKSLSILNVRFADENPDLVSRAQQVIEEAELVNEERERLTPIDLEDFNGN